MQTIQSNKRMDLTCEAMITARLGDISAFPEVLAEFVRRIYREFIASYLNLLRQKEGKPPDWFPETLSIEPVLVDEMRHFFSDDQHITKAFLTLNLQMDELRKIDKDKQPNLYQYMVARILTHETTG